MQIRSFSKSLGIAVILSFFALGTVRAQVLFDPPRNFLSGDGILSIVSKDFNRDGLLDIATSNKKTDSVSVHLNLGSGIFAEPWAEYHVGPFAPLLDKEKPKALPIGVASGDFDNDTFFDLVVSNSDSDTVSVLMNNGDGTFGAATDFTVRTDGISPNPGNPENYHILHPEAVTTCDFNGDGKLDIATANSNGSRVSVLLGDGFGAFGLPVQYVVGRQPISLTCGDFDNDGAFDIAIANNGPEVIQLVPGSLIFVQKYTVSVLWNQGDGIFAPEIRYEVGPNPVQVIAADLDGDTFLDLITANHVVAGDPAPNPSWVSVLMNNGLNGLGTFASEIQVATDQFPNSVAAADLNINGRLDLITVQDYTPGTFSVSTQNEDGTFAPFVTYSPGVMNAPNVLVAADFDGDGDVDLLASSKNSDDFSLLLNQLKANPSPPPDTVPPTGGDPDLIVLITKLKAEYKDPETKFEVQVDLVNIGSGPAIGPFDVTLSLGGITLNTWRILDGVQVGVGVVLKYRPSSPILGSIVGQELIITADSSNTVAESDETNNEISLIID